MEYRKEQGCRERMMAQIKPKEFLIENSSLELERVKNWESISEFLSMNEIEKGDFPPPGGGRSTGEITWCTRRGPRENCAMGTKGGESFCFCF